MAQRARDVRKRYLRQKDGDRTYRNGRRFCADEYDRLGGHAYGHQTCHGGQLFTLADTAFAYACNSQGLAAVASAASIDFLRPAFAGDRLVATARVKQQGKLTGVYDIEIVNQQQKIVALFRGKSHRIGGTITGDV